LYINGTEFFYEPDVLPAIPTVLFWNSWMRGTGKLEYLEKQVLNEK